MNFFSLLVKNDKFKQKKSSEEHSFEKNENRLFFQKFLTYKKITSIEITNYKILKQKKTKHAVDFINIFISILFRFI